MAAGTSAAAASADPAEGEPTTELRALPLSVPGRRRSTRRRPGSGALVPVLAVIGLGAAGAIGYAIGNGEDSGQPLGGPAPAPTVIVDRSSDGAAKPDAADQIGFPAFATRNTTRVGGASPVADAAGVALASYPSVGDVSPPPLVVLAPTSSWQGALAASSLAAPPLASPILFGDPGEVPPFTAQALAAIKPSGARRLDGAQVIAIGDVKSPEGMKSLPVVGETDTAAALAKAVDRQRSKLSDVADPDHIMVVSQQRPEYAMPAAAWAGRSGDPIIFASKDSAPQETLDVLKRHPDSPVYVLGPTDVIGEKAIKELEGASDKVTRVGASGPVENSIAFARFVDGSFGWNINDPGHGFSIASSTRPLDAAASAPLAAGGAPGPLLVSDNPKKVPGALRNYLLDTKPGYVDQPERAFYNHIWLLGDTNALSVDFQAEVDQLTSLAPVSAGDGTPQSPRQPQRSDRGAAAAADSSGSGSSGSGADQTTSTTSTTDSTSTTP